MIQGDLTGICVSQYHNDWIHSNFVFQVVVSGKRFFYYNTTLSMTHTHTLRTREYRQCVHFLLLNLWFRVTLSVNSKYHSISRLFIYYLSTLYFWFTFHVYIGFIHLSDTIHLRDTSYQNFPPKILNLTLNNRFNNYNVYIWDMTLISPYIH